LSAGLGQNPSRIVALGAGLKPNTVCWTVNKVCASGMKCIMSAAQQIQLGMREIIVAGGMESMSNVPYYVPPGNSRKRSDKATTGNLTLVDGMVQDGLLDVYNQVHMANAAEAVAAKHGIDRKMQDEYALSSYQRAMTSKRNGVFEAEIEPVEIPKRGDDKSPAATVSTDEEPDRLQASKVPHLKPSFMKDGTITPANSSKLSDGAAAVVVVSRRKARQLGCKILATIRSYADAETEPLLYPISPSLAIPIALERAGLAQNDVDVFEINEAFSSVALVNMKLLNIHHDKININGGAVALGHPIGCSGARIVVSLISALQKTGRPVGAAALCNGGGGGSAIVLTTA